MRDFRRAAEQNPNYPTIVLAYQGTVEEGEPFFAALWPDARAVADPDTCLYRAFGVERGTMRQLFSPEVVACGVRATLKGNMVGPTQGDPRLMPGLFAFIGGRRVWQHHFRHAGDHPDFAAIPALIAAASA